MGDYRKRAWKAFERMPIPDPSLEAWRRTDLKALPAGEFRLAPLTDSAVPTELLQPLTADQHGGQLVIGSGRRHIAVDRELIDQGVIFTDLETACAKHSEIIQKILGQTVNAEEGKFAAMAGAFAQDGLLLYVPNGVVVNAPLHSVLWGPGAGAAHFSHILVYIDEGAEATYVHESASPTESQDALHAGIVEVIVAKGGSLRFVELQSWGRHIWNFTHERIRLEDNARLDWIFGAIGSRLTKNFSEVDLAGEGATGRMSGFYFTDGHQHLDHDTQQNHLAPHTTSDLLFKGALRGHSRSVWQGMIYVAKGASKTDGYQANRNLILDEAARADSIPGLEILADDVRCTHGATVGKLEKEPLFYLSSRGIPHTDAVRLLVEGFFDPIMQRIPFEGVRARFQQAILEKMESPSVA
ncbi:MAG TPA: Fe-S cluster assembly protein SufD [Anaerolineales bacterium]|nr:Fe-S cluster assembly protein SufD [Anaerolineales bacterium]